MQGPPRFPRSPRTQRGFPLSLLAFLTVPRAQRVPEMGQGHLWAEPFRPHVGPKRFNLLQADGLLEGGGGERKSTPLPDLLPS